MTEEAMTTANKLTAKITRLEREKREATIKIETLRGTEFPDFSYEDLITLREVLNKIYRAKIEPLKAELEKL